MVPTQSSDSGTSVEPRRIVTFVELLKRRSEPLGLVLKGMCCVTCLVCRSASKYYDLPVISWANTQVYGIIIKFTEFLSVIHWKFMACFFIILMGKTSHKLPEDGAQNVFSWTSQYE